MRKYQEKTWEVKQFMYCFVLFSTNEMPGDGREESGDNNYEIPWYGRWESVDWRYWT